MKKRRLQTLALIGMIMGVSTQSAPAAETLLKEQQEFYDMLDAEGQSQFLELDPKHRALKCCLRKRTKGQGDEQVSRIYITRPPPNSTNFFRDLEH